MARPDPAAEREPAVNEVGVDQQRPVEYEPAAKGEPGMAPNQRFDRRKKRDSPGDQIADDVDGIRRSAQSQNPAMRSESRVPPGERENSGEEHPGEERVRERIMASFEVEVRIDHIGQHARKGDRPRCPREGAPSDRFGSQRRPRKSGRRAWVTGVM